MTEQTNRQRFQAQLALAYADLFKNDPAYAPAASSHTPEQLAEKMLAGALDGRANHDGPGFKRACKALGIGSTRKAIKDYCEA